jgi:hypothetical protein
MPVVAIQDFSGMMPLRDPLLLPDNNAQYTENTWLYKGGIRGFRHAQNVYTLQYTDTQQLYRIPFDYSESPPDYTTAGSLWLEFPDPYMSVIRSPVVEDQWNRYYFFPSDQYNSTGVNPDWPITNPGPMYASFDPTTNTLSPLYILGMPTPAKVPIVVPSPTVVTFLTSAPTAAGNGQLSFGGFYTGYPTPTLAVSADPPANTIQVSSATGITVGMTVVDISNSIPAIPNGTFVTAISGTTITLSQNITGSLILGQTIVFLNPYGTSISLTTNAVSNPGDDRLHFSSVPGGIAINNMVYDLTHPASIVPGSIVTDQGSNYVEVLDADGNGFANTISSGDHILIQQADLFTLVTPDMLVEDLNAQTAWRYPSTSVAAQATTIPLPYTTDIYVGMEVSDLTNPGAIAPGTLVTTVNAGVSIVISIGVGGSGLTTGDLLFFINNSLPSNASVDYSAGNNVYLNQTAQEAGVFAGDPIKFTAQFPETRAYIYTYVSAYGEEGPASQPTIATGNPAGMWHITIPAPPAGTNTGRNITTVRLYRTVTDSSGNATYYKVADLLYSTSAINYYDYLRPTDIVNNLTLTTELYTPPPADLQGVVLMANGIAAGWSNKREIWFSAAYLPHAWPESFALTVDYPVVGMTPNGASLNILCDGPPSIATGVTPDTITIGKITANEPCIGRGSIVASAEGAYYASPNGIILVNPSGTLSITEFIYEKEFHNQLQPANWAAGRYGLAYVAFVKGAGLPNIDPDGDVLNGMVIDRQDKNVPFTYLHFNATVVNLFFDGFTGQLFGILSNGTVMQWNPPIGIPGTTTLWDWEWRSKKFRMPFAASMKCFQIMFDVPPEVMITLGQRNTNQSQIFDPTSQYLIVSIYADNKFIVVREVQKSEEVLLIPDGFKAILWEMRLQGQVNVIHAKMATSVKELRKA